MKKLILSIRSRYIRKTILLLIDFLFIFLACFLARNIFLQFRYDESYLVNYIYLTPFLGVFIYILTGQYNSLTRYMHSKFIYYTLFRGILLISALFILNIFIDINVTLIELFFIYIFSSNILIFYRIIVRDFIFLRSANTDQKKKNIVLYGADDSIADIISQIIKIGDYQINFIVDDSKFIKNLYVSGVKVITTEFFYEVLSKKKVDKLVILNQFLDTKSLNSLFTKTKKISPSTQIFKLPRLDNFLTSWSRFESLKPINLTDLLGRDSVRPDIQILERSVMGKSILVTGAGGSIGSELCRQILKYNPKRLIIIDSSEASLYSIDMELRNLLINDENIDICTHLGSLTNKVLIESILSKYPIDIVYHAAAYKHVPLVESNPIVGLYNNVASTLFVAKLSIKYDIKKFILISSDKAVRPSNIMGVSKRIAELIVQRLSFDKEHSHSTNFSIVRFGNVIGSSGSVVPLFQNQINSGGPITLTHKEIIRYFMTISEAVQLVMQTSILSAGGEIFLLDMGKPVKIYDLAKQMIILSGLSIKNEENPNGDIEIKITGIRAGEKLYEELLIDDVSEKTMHPLIFKSNEKIKREENFWDQIEFLIDSLESQNLTNVLKLAQELVPEWEKKY